MMTRVLRDRAEEQGGFPAAGELLAGVAHEVNNPLMAIAAHAENRLADAGLQGEQRSEMAQILRQARRATKLLRGLLRFVRATEREVTRVNLNDVVRGALDLVSYRFGVDEITVGGRLDPNLAAVEGDVIKLEQVVVNLLATATDAVRRLKPTRPGAAARAAATAPAPVVGQAAAAGPGDGTPPGGRSAAGATLAGVHVLIVEDEEGVRRPMARFLTRRGAEVEEAGDGVDGLG